MSVAYDVGVVGSRSATPVTLDLLSHESRRVTARVVDVDAGWSVSEPDGPAPT